MYEKRLSFQTQKQKQESLNVLRIEYQPQIIYNEAEKPKESPVGKDLVQNEKPTNETTTPKISKETVYKEPLDDTIRNISV